MYLVVEGLEGAGKTTALEFIHRYLTSHGFDIVRTYEPGGTPVADSLRGILKSVEVETLSPISEVLLMYTARAQVQYTVVQPALAAGKLVLSDRGELSSRAYQGAGNGMEHECEILANMVVPEYNPDLTIYIDIPPEVGLSRAARRGALDRIEQNKIDFFERARTRFLQEVETKPNVMMVDGSQSVEDVRDAITKLLDTLVIKRPLDIN